MPTVVLSSYNVANFPEGGGHLWVYMQYAQGLRQLGCDVYWMENFCCSDDEQRDAAALETFRARMERFGLGGKPCPLFPDCGLQWIHIRPPVCLEHWPYTFDPRAEAFTTVSTWSGDTWLVDEQGLYESTKRVSFLQFAELPRLTRQPLELALFLKTEEDLAERRLMESHGWRMRLSPEVAATPESYQAYVQGSRGEFSCAKRSCMKFQNAWVSDRTLCYLASGKPAVVQHTGPSAFLPNGEGLFRFSTLGEAAAALEAVNANYERHSRAARRIAETL